MFQKWLFSSPFNPVFKKNDKLYKENYRSVVFCITCQRYLKGSCMLKLKVSWKVNHQNCLQDSEKHHCSEHCLVNIFEQWKNAIDKDDFVYAMSMDLSNSFNTMNRDLLIAKLRAYGF